MVLIQFDPRFIEIEYELWALGHLRTVIEEQIAFLRAQDTLKTYAELKEQGWYHDEGERQLASQELDERQDYVIPRFFRGPFVVSLWASYESAVVEVAGYLGRHSGAALALHDIRARSELKQFRKYFDAVLKRPLDESKERLEWIEDIRVIRHALAHANGQQRAIPDDKWRLVSEVLTRRGRPPDEYRGVVILSETFVREAYEAVNSSLRDLVVRARSA